MSGNRSTWPLNEPEINREIEAALAVDPSPEFLARVRARLANEPAPAAWRFRWAPLVSTLAAIAVTAGITTVAVLRLEHQQITAVDRRALPSKSIVFTPYVAVQPTVQAHGVTVTPSRVAFAHRLHATAQAPRVQAEALLSRAESEALWRTVVTAREGHIVVSSDIPAPDIRADLQPPEIIIAPITIEPIVSQPESGSEEGTGSKE